MYREAIRKEIKDLKRGVKNERKQKETKEKEKLQEEEKKLQKSQLVNEYITTQKKYKEVSAKIPKKGEESAHSFIFFNIIA